MSGEAGSDGAAGEDVRRLEQSLAAISAQLAQVADQVARLSAARGAPAVASVEVAGPSGAADAVPPDADGLRAGAAAVPGGETPGTTPPSAAPPASVRPAGNAPPGAASTVTDAAGPAPIGAAPPGVSAQDAAPPSASSPSFPPRHPGPSVPPAPAYQPRPARAPEPSGPARVPFPAEPQRSWADTSGLKVLGWVGGGITVLGIVMLLVVAIQQGLLSPLARVLVGAVIGLLLIGGGGLLRRKESQTALAVTLAVTGLAALYLTTIGAVRLAELAPPVVGHGASAVIVVIGVSLALTWREPWLAGVSFAASALLAPIVGGGFGAGVLVFEALIVAGGAACLLLRVGLIAWSCAAVAAGLVLFVGIAGDELLPAELLVVIFVVLLTWALFLWRWAYDRAPADPGPFPLRPRSSDPAQIARDYADFHAHTARANAARADSTAATLSLAISAAALVVALAVARPVGVHEIGIGIIAAVFAALFAGLAWASGHIPPLSHLSLRVTTWSAGVACAAVALLRLLSGDARSISWLVLGIIVLVAVGVERILFLLVPALAVAGFAVLAAWPALSPAALFRWPSYGLLDGSGLLPRGWAVVLPAGVCVIALCAAGWWAVSRCSAARLAHVRSAQRSGAPAGPGHGYPADEAAAQARHTATTGWALVICSAVACYGLIAVTMVLAYAVSPTRTGYQAGQIAVTVFVALVALVLLWQGFRRVVLRLGGLGIAAVAVAKLLLFDTRTLEALPRAMTTIGVGVLLLLAAVAYVMTLSRVNAAGDAPADGAPAAPGAAPASWAVPMGVAPVPGAARPGGPVPSEPGSGSAGPAGPGSAGPDASGAASPRE